MDRKRYLVTCIALCIAASLWGLYWIPQRFLESAGMTGGWSTIAQYLISTALLIPLAIYRFTKNQQTGFDLPLAGALLGGGIVCYANSFLLTDVIRTMLLFYLTPLWATLIELVILRQRPGWWRAITLPLALTGVSLVISNGNGFPLPANLGDWLALAGGAFYAAGAARVQTVRVDGVFPILFAFFVYGSVVAVLQAFLLSTQLGPLPPVSTGLSLTPWLVLLCVFFFIPTNAIISWAPTQIGAGLFSILILTELVVGTLSAWLWANESFGWREVTGSVCILLAGTLEIILSPSQINNRQNR